MKLVKKSFVLAFALGLMMTAQKVQGQAAVGGGLAYGTEIESAGINLNGTYLVTDNIAIAPSLVYYFPKKLVGDYKMKWFEFDVNGHYYFDVPGIVRPYGLAGLNFSFITVPGMSYSFGGFGSVETEKETTTKVGLNIGGGAEFNIDAPITPFGQLNYSIIDTFDQLVIIAGVRFPLNF